MDSEQVFRPFFHSYFMKTCNSLRRGDCCGHFESTSEGYLSTGDFFFHKKCGDSPECLQHPSHSIHTLELRHKPWTEDKLLEPNICDLCGKNIDKVHYRCEICDFDIDLYCAMYPPPDVINSSETHVQHKLTLLKERIEFVCDAKCGKTGVEFPYRCHECDLNFHIDCVWNPLNHPSEVNHSYHSLHPLKLLRGLVPDYSDGKCRLYGREITDASLFYHCSSCNFTLDWRCALEPPPQSLLDLKAHDHQLTLLPRLFSFTCNACGLKGDRSPYMCVQCDFMIHQDCLGLPRVININRHDHRVSRIPLLGVVKSVCGVCCRKVDWTCGGFSCKRCPGYVVHSKCATRKDVWNGKELEGVPEEEEDIEPYVVIDDNTIHHFSHRDHYLRLHVNGIMYEESKRCKACILPIGLQSFYGCENCDFTLHKNCAEFPKKRWHVLHNERLALVTSETDFLWCDACKRISNGFRYLHGDKKFDVLCSSVSEPFVHPSHPDHPLYYIPSNEDKDCINCCNRFGIAAVLRCIEDDCEFVLCFGCATLPQVVKHRTDDHPLTLCYGAKASGKCWCDICEKETKPETWFYTCKDSRASLHTECVLGDTTWLMPGSTLKYFGILFEVVLNKSVSRPFCRHCKSHCIYAIILKVPRTSGTYFCSVGCMFSSCGSSNSSFSRSGAGRIDRYAPEMK